MLRENHGAIFPLDPKSLYSRCLEGWGTVGSLSFIHRVSSAAASTCPPLDSCVAWDLQTGPPTVLGCLFLLW